MSGGYRKYLECMLPRLARHPGISSLLVGMPSVQDVQEYQKSPSGIMWLHWGGGRARAFLGIRSREEHIVEDFAPDVVFVPTARSVQLADTPVVTMLRNMEPLAYATSWNHVSERVKNCLRRHEALGAPHRVQ